MYFRLCFDCCLTLLPCALSCAQALYIAYRVVYLWDTFSAYHMVGASILAVATAVCYFMIARAASPKYAPLEKGGQLVSGGSDLGQSGVLEYTWDMLYVTMFVQLTTGFISDWFWLLYLIPPCVAFYYLWTKVIYPWISKPDEEKEEMPGSAAGVQWKAGQRQVKKQK